MLFEIRKSLVELLSFIPVFLSHLSYSQYCIISSFSWPESKLRITNIYFFPVAGTFVPKNFRSRERKFHRVELSLLGAKVPWNFHSLELSLPGTFAPRNESSMELLFPGTFALWNFRSLPFDRPNNSKY